MGFLGFFGKKKKEEATNVDAARQAAQDNFTLDPNDMGLPQDDVQQPYDRDGLLRSDIARPQYPPTIEGQMNEMKYLSSGQQAVQSPLFQRPQPEQSKDMQLVLSKLDVINAKLDNVHRRVEMIERIAAQEQAQDNQRVRTIARRMW